MGPRHSRKGRTLNRVKFYSSFFVRMFVVRIVWFLFVRLLCVFVFVRIPYKCSRCGILVPSDASPVFVKWCSELGATLFQDAMCLHVHWIKMNIIPSVSHSRTVWKRPNVSSNCIHHLIVPAGLNWLERWQNSHKFTSLALNAGEEWTLVIFIAQRICRF